MSSEIQSILNAFDRSQHRGKSAFLATVVGTQGSTYRRPGARLFIAADGETVGLVSGGCLERDLVEHTQLMPDNRPKIVTYDHTATEDILWGFGLGCTGTVRVLVERLRPPHDPLTFLARCWRDRTPGVLVSIIQTEGNATQLGACLTLTAQAIDVLGQSDPDLIAAIVPDTRSVLRARQSVVKRYDLANCRIEVFIEFIEPPISLVIFGAGQDAIPLAQFAKALGWHVTVVDCRANPLSHERFAMCDRVILTRRERLDRIVIPAGAVAAILTHNYYDDLEILRGLLPAELGYIGLLGSRQRTQRLLQELQQDLTSITEQFDKLHAPVGLDIGAETPTAIALSIVAEIQAVLSDRPGNSLKYRNTSIHDTHQDRLTPARGWSLAADGYTQTVIIHSRN
ncbi:XdhC family protein [Chamaesiphon minutus]|uniref:Xanthine and CO dehydrogenases maturation factor, XdhC/CoxF family n=1 Tax=Chamaesiphon minutus (strain ATCC 27169 / PCC 6605) TaxID=1173020 RepID=K9UE53_CHAP6|nr:XdhC/CoxI family protein [Chamaesiphon minutus]AFY92706.1 xanthine and CO dehydrogenases maturation factor, XdhC/CoxF family [Chamaesiphon minutus PCC 6605]